MTTKSNGFCYKWHPIQATCLKQITECHHFILKRFLLYTELLVVNGSDKRYQDFQNVMILIDINTFQYDITKFINCYSSNKFTAMLGFSIRIQYIWFEECSWLYKRNIKAVFIKKWAWTGKQQSCIANLDHVIYCIKISNFEKYIDTFRYWQKSNDTDIYCQLLVRLRET